MLANFGIGTLAGIRLLDVCVGAYCSAQWGLPGGEDRAEDPVSDAGPKRDKPWIFRTYAGHSTACESNAARASAGARNVSSTSDSDRPALSSARSTK